MPPYRPVSFNPVSQNRGRFTLAPADFPMNNLMHEMADVANFAALVANLDLVISVETAVMHWAAAMGKPV